MSVIIVVNNPKEWPFEIDGVEVVDARSYLTQPDYGQRRGVKLFNLCRSYRYQSTGYYVTLLAAARGHRPIPSIGTMQDMRSQSIVRFVSDDLDEMIQKSLSRIVGSKFTLSIYFGRNLAKRYDQLSKNLFNLFQAPLLRAHFVQNGRWQLRKIGPIPVSEIPDSHRSFVLDVASQHFAGRRTSVRKQSHKKYDLAILLNQEDPHPPSDEKAIKRFIKAAESMGLGTEIISRDDYGRLAEFDALFIRETTAVNHHTYRFAQRAAAEGLVVIDDPESIVRCTNKVYLAELLRRQNISTPRSMLIHKDNVECCITEIGLPVVLKQPDSSFSQGVIKVDTPEALKAETDKMFEKSDLIVAQEFLPSDYDWRIGVLDRQAIYACKYFMVKNHWQIYKEDGKERVAGKWETLPVEIAPRHVVKTALKAANLIGSGLYGVDLKQIGNQCYIMEVNDNPSIDSDVEDAILKEELYRRVMKVFLTRIEDRKAGVNRL